MSAVFHPRIIAFENRVHFIMRKINNFTSSLDQKQRELLFFIIPCLDQVVSELLVERAAVADKGT